MPTCGRPYHALAPAIQLITRSTPCRLVRASLRPSASRPSSTLSLSPGSLNASPAESSPQGYSRERKLNNLRESLLRGASPSRVWIEYNDLLNVMGFEKLPLEVHQQVLRRCTSPSAEHRVNVGKRLAAGNSPPKAHVHEGRFQTIIHNIRASSTSPDLDDYHFILEQFAAVGHHIGVMRVYKELRQAGIEPQPKTFSLCLQAIARRMTLPVPNTQKEHRSEETRMMMYSFVREMRKLRIAFTATNLDLTIRILKETLDMEAFEEMMKWGYGIDLSHPDCPPLEFLASQNIKSDLGIQVPETTIPTQQPFSTAALNTTIDILGRIGNVSKLVQAFEVLTQPLPRAKNRLFSLDDDDDGGVANTPHSTWIPPHAYPNTTSYIMLIRHLCWAGHAILARHYAREAISLDLRKERRTKTKILTRRNEIPAPTIAVNRGTLLPILGLSNRTKNLALTRWLTRKLPGILRIKRYNLEYYIKYREKLEKKQAAEQARAEAKRRKVNKGSQQNLSPDPSTMETSDVDTFSADTNTDISTISTLVPDTTIDAREDGQPISLIERSRRNRPQDIDIFELDIDSLPSPSSKEPVRLLDIDLHIRVLQRDIDELEEFSERVDDVLGRNTQRMKEHLGRRVWAGKDVYLADENIRRKVSREEWIESVGFNHKKPRDPPQGPLPKIVAKDGSSTPFFQSNQITKPEVPLSVLEHLAHGASQS
ncbi:hypothetical protein C0993_004052 [Termitomyces sp. T159_Od127]|nr:hypothetical protein C0993_004052 [Termitomyces sp. T159_Od127]